MEHGYGRAAALALMVGVLGAAGAPAAADVQAPTPTAQPTGRPSSPDPATPSEPTEAISEGDEGATTAPGRATAAGTSPKAGVVVADAASGTVFSDTNGNGSRDAGEAALPGAPVTLAGDGRVRSTVTGADGGYTLGDVPAGTYTLIVEPAGHQAVSRSVIAAGGASAKAPLAPAAPVGGSTTVPAADGLTVLTGTVTFRSEPVSADLTFSRQGRADVTVTADDAGRYTVSLAPGDYTVRITVPELLRDVVTSDARSVTVAGTDQTHDVALQVRDRDCTTSDFSSVQDAQAVHDRLKPRFGDVFGLDSDRDGKVCEDGLGGAAAGTGASATAADTAARATPRGTSAAALARTGTETWPATLLATGLIAAGAALRVASLRRPVRLER